MVPGRIDAPRAVFWALACTLAVAAVFACLAPRGMIWAMALGGALTLLAGLASGLRRPPWPRGWAWAVLVVLLLWAAISSAWTTAPAAAETKLLQFLGLFGFGSFLLLWVAALSPGQARRLASVFAAAFAIALGVLGVELAADFPLFRWVNQVPAEQPLDRNIVNQNLLLVAVLIWPVSLFWLRMSAWYGPVPQRLAILIACVAIGWILVLDSESAKLAVLAGGGLWMLARWRWQVACWAGFCGLLASLLLAVPIAHGLYAAGLRDAPWLHRNFQHRVEIWHEAASRLAERPVTGWGLEASRDIPRGDRISVFFPEADSLIPLHPHNASLHILLELGVIGALLVAALAALLLRQVAALAPRDRPYAVACFGAAWAGAQTAYGVFQGWWLASFFCALLLFCVLKALSSSRIP